MRNIKLILAFLVFQLVFSQEKNKILVYQRPISIFSKELQQKLEDNVFLEIIDEDRYTFNENFWSFSQKKLFLDKHFDELKRIYEVEHNMSFEDTFDFVQWLIQTYNLYTFLYVKGENVEQMPPFDEFIPKFNIKKLIIVAGNAENLIE